MDKKKEFIIKYLENYYITFNEIPKSSDKNFPFSSSTVSNYFGTWNNALSLANIPIRVHKHMLVICKHCSKEFLKNFSQIKKQPNHYCTHSCAAKYNNTHRKSGNRISKLEIFLQNNLNGFVFEYNNRTICDGLELDIYIPSLKLAFEINGIFHYKPIFGIEKLEKIIKKDNLKKEKCSNKGILLISIIDESHNFNIKYANMILNDIYTHIFKNFLYHIASNK